MGPPELWILDTADHSAATLDNHTPTHRIPITVPRGMTRGENKTALHYGAHASATQVVEFVHQELAKQIQADHIMASPWDTIAHLYNLWLYPVLALPHEGRRPCLIVYLMWSSLNAAVTPQAPQEAMCFRGTLYRVSKCLLMPEPRLGPIYLSKVDLTDAHIRLWFRF